MTRRDFLINAAIATVGIAFFGSLAWGVWDMLRQGGALNCQSDYLSRYAAHLSKYAKNHDGNLPPANELLAVARGDFDNFPGCRHIGLPYQWDLRLAGSPVAALNGRALAWCPPGGHGRHVAAIVIRDGELRAENITISELRQLVAE